MSCLLIRDGYTLDGKIPGKGARPALCFRYRPALAEDTYEYLHQTRLTPGKGQVKVAAKFLADHLVGWDVKNDKGEVEPHTPENIRRLPPPVLSAMLDIVMGYSEVEQEADAKN